MISSLVLAFREGLEACLVIAIILAYLSRTGRKDLMKHVYSGAFLGLAISLIGGFIVYQQAQELAEESEELFEGVMMLLASGLIAYFIVWMGNRANISSNIKNAVEKNTTTVGLLVLSFLSVFREGLELSIFTMTKLNERASDIAVGSILGILAAVLLTYLIFKTSVKFNLKFIFKILGLILIFIGAEMFSEGILKLVSLDEAFEVVFIVLFAVPSLYIFLREDIKGLFKKA